MRVRYISSHSDIEVVVIFRKTDGTEIPVPGYDFELDYYVGRDKVFTAKSVDKELTNCDVMDDDRLHVFIKNPGFPAGRLHARHVLHIPNDEFNGNREPVMDVVLPVCITESDARDTVEPVITDVVTAELDNYTTYLSSEDGNYLTTEDGNFLYTDTSTGRN